MTDEQEWPEVERRESERRTTGPAQHVSIDGISNGARRLIQDAIDEARKTRRWIVGALLGVGAFVFAAGEFRGETRAALSNRPTEQAVLEMVQSRDSAMVQAVQGQQNVLEMLIERSESQRRRLDRIEDDHRTGVP